MFIWFIIAYFENDRKKSENIFRLLACAGLFQSPKKQTAPTPPQKGKTWCGLFDMDVRKCVRE